MIDSLWRRDVSIAPRQPLTGDLKVQVAVIGAGMAGILTAHMLAKGGAQVAVLEAGRIGSGQTGGTTAKITSQHNLIYRGLIDRLGAERAAQFAQANQLAIDAYARLVEQEAIACDFRRLSAYLYTAGDVAPLEQEARAASDLGIPARFEGASALPCPATGLLRFDDQAQFHPLKLLNHVAQPLTVYENTRVMWVDGHRIGTAAGTVRAEYVVFCAHYPFVNVPGWYFMRMHQERSYVLALQGAWVPDGMYLGIDPNGLSFREADGLTLLGGEGHRTGENSDGGCYRRLWARARALFPDCEQRARWSAQDCMTLDNVPYIGFFAKDAPNWLVATGFRKWGMTSSMVAALAISQMILRERAPDWAGVFSPQRFHLSASAQALATDTAQAMKGLARQAFSAPHIDARALKPGHGGIVEQAGRKAGVYVDEAGALHVIDPRCPHLGCQLSWNPDELTWDCPCHGSRLDYAGNLLCGPALEGARPKHDAQ